MSEGGEQVVRTGCPYCGVGCGLRVTTDAGRVVGVEGDPEHPVNRGRTCAKPLSLASAVHAADRATTPMRRTDPDGPWERLGWDDAIGWAAGRLRAIVDEHGPEAVAFYVSGQLLTEDYYAVNKLAKGFLGTNTVDSNSRLCMSSAVAGYKATFGSDGPPPSYDDLDRTDCLLLLGSNTAACHPIVWARIKERRDAAAQARRDADGGSDRDAGDADPPGEPYLIVVDPRRTPTAAAADLHLAVRPGGDVPLLLGMLHVVERDGLLDEAFLAERTEGWDDLRAQVAEWDPERAAEASGVPARQLEEAARRFASAGAAMSLWTMGANQSRSGTDKNRALHALCLATGQFGRPGAGPLSLTGQPNAMGGREMGGLASLLPGYRDARDADDREAVATYWDLPPDAAGISDVPGLAAVDLFDAVHDGRVKAVWVIATNPAVSLPRGRHAREALRRAELLVVQDAYHPTETSMLADLVLPAAAWAEKAGTMTSSERRVTLMRPAVQPPGDALPDWRIVARLAAELGWGEHFAWRDAAAVHAEAVGLTAGRVCDQTGISHGRLGRMGGSIRWPYSAADDERAMDDLLWGGTTPDGEPAPAGDPFSRREAGSARLYADGPFPTPSGRARLGRLDDGGPAEPPDAEHPLVLTTGRVAGQWHTMTRTGKAPELLEADPEPFVELHPDDAAAASVEDRQTVDLVSPRGRARVRARVAAADAPDAERVPRGVAFAPFGWGALHARAGAGQANDLAHGAVDPVSFQPELKAMAVRVEPVAVGARPIDRSDEDTGVAAPVPRGGRPRARERLVVVGGGMASVAVLEAAFAHRDPSRWDATILGGEPVAPYDRVRISTLVRPDAVDDVDLRPEDWYADRDVDLRTGAWVDRLDTDAHEAVLATGERVPYDKAVVATGSRPSLPPILGLHLGGVIPFRTRADAAKVRDRVGRGTMVTVVGGGLLGLEAAAGLAAHGASVTIVHRGDRLMERQLDRGAARLVERRIRELGIQMLFGKTTERIVGAGDVTGVRFADGDELATDLVVLATGIQPEIGVGLRSGLACSHAITVDDELRTSVPRVWAVGECAEHRGVTYGLWAPIAEQARIAGATLAGVPAGYHGSPLSTTLKVVGIDLFACGRPWFDTDDDDVDEVMSIDTRGGRYRRVVLREGRLLGAVLLGDGEMAAPLTDLADGDAPVPDDVLDEISATGSGGPRRVPDDRLVCSCNRVPAGKIREAIADGADSVEGVRERTGASGGCGSCASRVGALVHEALPEAAVAG